MEETEDFKMCFRPLLNITALVCELLSNNSLFACQLYKDKSPALHTHDLIIFTTDSELLLNNSLLELIYFLNLF